MVGNGAPKKEGPTGAPLSNTSEMSASKDISGLPNEMAIVISPESRLEPVSEARVASPPQNGQESTGIYTDLPVIVESDLGDFNRIF